MDKNILIILTETVGGIEHVIGSRLQMVGSRGGVEGASE